MNSRAVSLCDRISSAARASTHILFSFLFLLFLGATKYNRNLRDVRVAPKEKEEEKEKTKKPRLGPYTHIENKR